VFCRASVAGSAGGFTFDQQSVCSFLAHELATHFDAVGVVNQTVQDAIGDGGIADLLVPARDRRGKPTQNAPDMPRNCVDAKLKLGFS